MWAGHRLSFLSLHCFFCDISFAIQISGCEDKTSFTDLMSRDNVLDCLGQAGSNGLPKFENKKRLLAELCHFFVIGKAFLVIEQFKEGLATLNVLHLMKSQPDLFEEVFCHRTKTLTSTGVDSIFKPCLSDEGTRQRDQEELVVMFWRDYLQECEGKH